MFTFFHFMFRFIRSDFTRELCAFLATITFLSSVVILALCMKG